MLLITVFVELRVVAGRSRTWGGSCAVTLRRMAWSEHGMGMAQALHGKCESDVTALCKSNGKDTF
jgi:hypothetical protein